MSEPAEIAAKLTKAQRDWIAYDIHPHNAAARRAVRNALIRRGLLNFDSPPPILTGLGFSVRYLLLLETRHAD